jgi:ABC-type transport system involved in multi-copper enzyme maturation permease subunit
VIQTFALFLDAYRELNSKKLFWITLILSGIVIGAFGFLSVSGQNLSFAGMTLPMNAGGAMFMYKYLFSALVIGLWLTWAAIALAIISTAGMFPDLITGGTIDLYLSKPMGRLRLFLTKYLTGLLFVTLQVSVFALVSFVIFGIRGKEWRPSIFLAIPLTVTMFSYLFCFCVLIGVWTRSTVAAILLTVIFWFGCFGFQKADESLLSVQSLMEKMQAQEKREIAFDAMSPENPRKTQMLADRQKLIDRGEDYDRTISRIRFFHRLADGVNAVVPKTTQTTNLLDRYLFTDDEAAGSATRRAERSSGRRAANGRGDPFGANEETMAETAGEVQTTLRSQSPWFIIGTSLASEAVILSLAAWIFCRRDY